MRIMRPKEKPIPMERKEEFAVVFQYSVATCHKETSPMMKQSFVRPYFAFLLFVCLWFGGSLHCWAMPGFLHLQGAEKLMGIPAAQGGVGDMSLQELKRVFDYMDEPSRRIGQYSVRVSDGKVLTPLNHGDLHHNPRKVARVWQGNRLTPPKEVMNAARLHKIQDVANNTVGKVSNDGWIINANMQKQANDILLRVSRGKGLPKHLPKWVDQSGPRILAQAGKGKAPLPAGTLVTTGGKVATGGKTVAKGLLATGGKVATSGKAVAGKAVANLPGLKSMGWISVAISAAVYVPMAMYQYNQLEDEFYGGEMGEEEFLLAAGECVGRAVGGVVGSLASTCVFVFLAPLGPAGFVVAAIASFPITYLAEYAGEYLGRMAAKAVIAWRAYQYRLDYAMYEGTMDYLVDEHLSPELFNRVEPSRARRDAYRKAWENRKEETLSEDPVFLPEALPTESHILRDSLIGWGQ